MDRFYLLLSRGFGQHAASGPVWFLKPDLGAVPQNSSRDTLRGRGARGASKAGCVA